MFINLDYLASGGGGIDSAATQAMIDASLEGYYTSGETETAINTALGDYLSKADYEPKELAVSAALNQLNTDKQEKLQSGINIKKVAGEDILGSGNIKVLKKEDMEDYLESKFEPKELAISAALNQLNSDVQTISGNTPDMSFYTPTSGFSTINGSAITEGTNIVIEGGGSGTELLPVSEFPESAETGTLIAKTNQEPSLGYWELSEGVLTFHLIDTGFTGSTIIGRLYNNATEPMLPGDIIITLEYGADDIDVLEYVISVENADNPDDYITIIPYNAGGGINYEFDTIGEDPESTEPIVVTYDFLADTNLVISKTNQYAATAVPIVSTDYEEGNLPTTTVIGIYQYDGSEWLEAGGGVDSGAVQTLIDASLVNYYTSAQTDTQIANSLSGYVTTSTLDNTEAAFAQALTQLNLTVSGKQDTLVDGTNIKTINGSGLTGSGNIVVATPDEVQDVEDNINAVVAFVGNIDAKLSALSSTTQTIETNLSTLSGSVGDIQTILQSI